MDTNQLTNNKPKKDAMKKISFLFLSMLMVSTIFFSCSKDEKVVPEPIARFTATADTTNPFLIIFTNDSQNADTYIWAFGDGSAISTEMSPTHTYAEAGDYSVTLTATGKGGVSTSTKTVTVEGFTLAQFLSGTDAAGKSWYLEFNDLISMVNPDNPSEWWYGWSALSVAQRNVVRHHEYIFKPDGSFEFKTHGYTVRPGDGGFSTPYLFDSETTPIFADSDSWIAKDGKDCSAWGKNANITFTVGDASKYAAYCDSRITLNGKGGHIGPMDTGTELVVDEPAASTFYEVFYYADGGDQPDTLVLYTPWGSNEAGPGATRGALGVIKLVSYKDASQIPADEQEPTGKPLQANDISETFDVDGTMTWAFQDANAGDIFDENFDNPSATGINTSAKVAKYYRSGGFAYTNAQFVMNYRMDLSTRNVFKMKVYYPSGSGGTKQAAIKLQNSLDGGNAWQTQTEVIQTFTAEDTWVELTFDFSSVSTNTDYDQIVVQFGGEGDGTPAGTFYFDDLVLQ